METRQQRVAYSHGDLTLPKADRSGKGKMLPNRRDQRKVKRGVRRFTVDGIPHARIVSRRRATPASFHTTVELRQYDADGQLVKQIRVNRENWGGNKDAS